MEGGQPLRDTVLADLEALKQVIHLSQTLKQVIDLGKKQGVDRDTWKTVFDMIVAVQPAVLTCCLSARAAGPQAQSLVAAGVGASSSSSPLQVTTPEAARRRPTCAAPEKGRMPDTIPREQQQQQQPSLPPPKPSPMPAHLVERVLAGGCLQASSAPQPAPPPLPMQAVPVNHVALPLPASAVQSLTWQGLGTQGVHMPVGAYAVAEAGRPGERPPKHGLQWQNMTFAPPPPASKIARREPNSEQQLIEEID
jgi:hypothetical protein